MMATFTALYDSNVLYPAPLRDFLMHLALTDLFRAIWTNRIHDEWIRNLKQNRPDIDSMRLERTRELMNSHIRDCLVAGYEDLIPSLKLPDPDDRHVLAAAIKGRADVIVTYNMKDFPESELMGYGIEAQHPDVFINHLIDLSHIKVCRAAHYHRVSLANPQKTVQEYLDTLQRQELPQTVLNLREYGDFL